MCGARGLSALPGPRCCLEGHSQARAKRGWPGKHEAGGGGGGVCVRFQNSPPSPSRGAYLVEGTARQRQREGRLIRQWFPYNGRAWRPPSYSVFYPKMPPSSPRPLSSPQPPRPELCQEGGSNKPANKLFLTPSLVPASPDVGFTAAPSGSHKLGVAGWARCPCSHAPPKLLSIVPWADSLSVLPWPDSYRWPLCGRAWGRGPFIPQQRWAIGLHVLP